MKDRIEELYQPKELTDDLITNEDEINRIKESDETAWDYIFADSKEDAGDKFKFRMRDVDTPASYEDEIDYYDPTAIQIETEIKGQKKWIDDGLKNRPSAITVYLLANGEKVNEQTVTARTNWAYKFTNIPVYDAQGEKIIYSVKEKAVVGYQTTYDHFTITNERLATDEDDQEDSIATSRTTRIGLFVLGAAAITASLLLDQIRKEK